MGRFILSAFADEYDDSLEAQLQGLKSFGIGFIELRFVDKKNISALTDAELSEVKRRLDESGIRVSAIGSPLGKIRLDEDTEAHLRLTERVCEIASRLGTRYIRMFSFYPPKDGNISEHRDKVLSLLERMLEIAERYGVILCHENEARIYGEAPESCLDLLSHFGGRLKAVFDMGNFALEGYDPVRAYRMLREYIEYFHIKDGFAHGAIVPAGKGEAHIAEILSDYAAGTDREVFISLEPHLETFSGLNALTDAKLEHSYVYENRQAAFTDAVAKLKEILN